MNLCTTIDNNTSSTMIVEVFFDGRDTRTYGTGPTNYYAN